MESRIYPDEPLYEGQHKEYVSLFLNPHFYFAINSALSLTISPFVRADSGDEKRSYFDFQEFYFLLVKNNREVRVGVDKTYWGVTESQHLVDIINQTNFAESTDGEDKFGQPMVNFSYPSRSGTFDIFILPYFRERIFPGKKGRMTFPLKIDYSKTIYDSSEKKRHIDSALRYSHTFGDWDIGISHFRGTSRDPLLKTIVDNPGRLKIVPLYHQIDQTGIDLQVVADAWLWKLEAVYRSGGEYTFQALTGGFEYTFPRFPGGDLGILGEWLYDTRRGKVNEPLMENDVMVGVRYGAYDVEGTQLVAGIIQDLDSDTKMLTLEASRRLDDNWKIFIELNSSMSVEEKDPLYIFRNDDRAELEFVCFY